MINYNISRDLLHCWRFSYLKEDNTQKKKKKVTQMRTINYTQDMAESTNTLFVNNAMSTGRENGLNKAYLYGKQAQVQYINLE